MKKKLYILFFLFGTGLLIASPFLYFLVTLPSAASVLASSDPGYTSKEKTYPPFLRCALRINSEDTRFMAYRIAERLPEPDTGFFYDFQRHVLVYPVRITYPAEARRKVYLKLFATSEKYPSIEQACIGLFKKKCKELSDREAVLFVAWMFGREKNMENVAKDEADIKHRVDEVRTRCAI